MFSALSFISVFFSYMFTLLWALFFVGSIFVFYPLALLATAFSLPIDKNRSAVFLITSIWSRLLILINPYLRVSVSGREFLNHDKPVVFVSNHQSMLDILVMYFLKTKYRWVAKKELLRAPAVGWLMQLNRDIPFDRAKGKSALQMIEKAKQTINTGNSIIIFPEGTRSENNQLQRFKDGAFKIALETQSDIQPVIINGTGDAMPKNKYVFGHFQHIHIRVLRPVTYDTFKNKEIMDIRKEVHEMMKKYIDHSTE